MHIEYLNEFSVLARTRNYRKAASELHISQSALSKHISSLEATYGCELLDRGKFGVELTEAGMYLLECADHIWDEFEESLRFIKVNFDRNNTLSCCGVLDNAGDYPLVAAATRLMQKEMPDCQVNLIHCSSVDTKTLLETLAANDADCASLYNTDLKLAEEHGFTCESIGTIPAEITVGKDNPLAQLDVVGTKDLENAELLQFVGPRYTPLWSIIEAGLKRRGISFTTRPIMTLSSYTFQTSLHDIGPCSFIAPKRSTPVMAMENDNLATRPISADTLEFRLDIAYKPENMHPLLKPFIRAMRKTYAAEASALVD